MWIQPLLLTLQLMLVAVVVAAVVGIVGAWGASTLESRGRLGYWSSRFFLAAMMLTVAIPMILHAAAWEATAGKFGWMIMTQTGARGDASAPYVFFGGLTACGWIHGLVGGALVALACWYGTQRVPAEVIEQSRLDLSPFRQWWLVRLPFAAPWWTTALVATAMLAATEMTVVDLYGYRTLADEFYLFYAADPSITAVWMTCVVPLGIASGGMLWWAVSRRRLSATNQPRDRVLLSDDQPAGPLLWLAALVTLLVASTMLVVPIAGLLVKLGHEVVVQDDRIIAHWSASACLDRLLEAPMVFADEYRWTLVLAAVTSITALLIAWPMASLARTHRTLEKGIDVITVMMVIIPGPIVAMAVVSMFQSSFPGFRFLYQQTIAPTVLALLARGVPVAYWVLRAAYRGIDGAVLDAASLDMSWARRMWSVDRSILRPHLFAAVIATAIVASGDVPATLPVIPPGMTTVGTRLFGLLHSGARYQEAALAIWYVAAIVAISPFFARQQATHRVNLK